MPFESWPNARGHRDMLAKLPPVHPTIRPWLVLHGIDAGVVLVDRVQCGEFLGFQDHAQVVYERRPDGHGTVASPELINGLLTSRKLFHEAEHVPQMRFVVQRELGQVANNLTADRLSRFQQMFGCTDKIGERRAI